MNTILAGIFAISTMVMMVMPFILALSVPYPDLPNPYWAITKRIAWCFAIFYFVDLAFMIVIK